MEYGEYSFSSHMSLLDIIMLYVGVCFVTLKFKSRGNKMAQLSHRESPYQHIPAVCLTVWRAGEDLLIYKLEWQKCGSGSVPNKSFMEIGTNIFKDSYFFYFFSYHLNISEYVYLKHLSLSASLLKSDRFDFRLINRKMPKSGSVVGPKGQRNQKKFFVRNRKTEPPHDKIPGICRKNGRTDGSGHSVFLAASILS